MTNVLLTPTPTMAAAGFDYAIPAEYLGPALRRNGEPMKRSHGGRYVGYSLVRVIATGAIKLRRNDLIAVEVAARVKAVA